MKTNVVIFGVVGCFLAIVGIVYAFVTIAYDPHGIEWVGVPAFFALGAMCWMIAVYLWMNERRFGKGAGDREDAPVSEEAGVQGTFAPYSWAPLITAFGGATAFGGMPVGAWLTAIGVCIAMGGVIWWVMEFSLGSHKH